MNGPRRDQKVSPFVENISESMAACLVTMVQGNLLAITLGHLAVALQTGVVAGAIVGAILIFWERGKPWLVSALLGVVTAVVDFFVHEGQFGSLFTEALVTGFGAFFLSWFAGALLRRWRQRTQPSAPQ